MTTKELQMAKKQTKNSSTNNVIEETKEINKVEIPVEQLIGYIVAKIDYLTDVIETRIPPVQKLK